jgi:aspartyl-tRNA(Asn)/glutamyl-tRNA(Gln) amidotransferase subunit C
MEKQEEISPQLFEHLVNLASLHLDLSEAEYLRRELNHQLQSIRELAAIEIPQGLSINVHGIPYPPNSVEELRQDLPEPFANTSALLDQAPQLENGQFAVPEIPHKTLE